MLQPVDQTIQSVVGQMQTCSGKILLCESAFGNKLEANLQVVRLRTHHRGKNSLVRSSYVHDKR